MNTHTIYIAILILLLLLLSSCTDEHLDRPVIPQECPVTFSLQMPRASTAASGTGLTASEERLIKDLTLLLFQPNALGDEECVGIIENLIPTPVAGTDSAQYTVRTGISEGTYRIMLLANVKDKLSQASAVGTLRTDIESSLWHEMQTTWDISDHAGFPMWGILKDPITVHAGTVYQEEILMLRMLARINLSVSEDIQDNLKVKKIRLHNPSGRGRVIPDPSHLDFTTTPGYIRAILPTLPLNSGIEDPRLLTTPWEYTAVDIEDEAYCLNTIYAMEGFEPQGRNKDEYAWLEVGATYKGGNEKLYRIDFGTKDTQGNKTLMPLLRNHTYEISIDGMNEIEEELEVTVTPWDDADMSEVIIVGQYFLKVSRATLNFDREARDENSFTNDLTITTNHEDGWKITKITDPNNNDAEIDMDSGWLQIKPQDREGAQDIDKTIKLLLKKNETTAPRSADIHLQVGRLIDFIVKVNQSTETVLELFVEYPDGTPVSELFFYEYYGWDDNHEPQEFRVRWSPKGLSSNGGNYYCKVDVNVSGDEYFAFDPSGSTITNGNLTNADGFQDYSVFPRKFDEREVSKEYGNPFLHRGMRVTFTVTDENNPAVSISKSIYLRHQHMAIISKDISRETRLGDTKNFHVLSNTAWRIDSVKQEADGILVSADPTYMLGGNNINIGDRITYTTVSGANNARGRAGRKFTYYISDLQGFIPYTHEFSIMTIYPDPNCYMLHPTGTNTVDIPIRKLKWAWDVYAEQPLAPIASGSLQAGVVWDAVFMNNDLNNNPLANYGNSISLQIIPDGTDFREDILRVTLPASPSNVSGNVVVGVRRSGTNYWLYSWHLWITDYDPASNAPGNQLILSNTGTGGGTYVFMNRTMGALEYTETHNEPSAIGMFYQWGRKDPLRMSFISTSSPAVSAANNLGNALNNPTRFYRSAGAGLGDWFTNQTERQYQLDDAWNDRDNRKGVFDPCPEGWRVPGSTWTDVKTPWDNMMYLQGNSAGGYPVNIRMKDIDLPSDWIYLPVTGRFNSNGNYTEYASSGSPSCNFFNSTPLIDFPSWGALISLGLQGRGYGLNNFTNRASACPVICVRDN